MSRLRATLGRPLGWLYGVVVDRRHRRYDRPGAQHRAEVPVLSVGNLSAGGTGKTPLVAYLAEEALRRGGRPAIVSRGYGGRAGAGPVVVSDGNGPLFDARISGDEPQMLARKVPAAIVVVGSNRRAGVATAARLGATLILLDDGFQHRALARDLDIVLVDRTRPFTHDHLIPAGYLRESASALTRADLVMITRSASRTGAEELEAAIRKIHPRVPIFHVDYRVRGFRDTEQNAVAVPTDIVAFCGIGNPQSFRKDLIDQGCNLVAFHALRDHQRIRETALSRLAQHAHEKSATLVTTEKDLARLDAAAVKRTTIVVLEIECWIAEADEFLASVWRAVEERG